MYCKKDSLRTPSYSTTKKSVEIFLFHLTTDDDLFKGLEVCYKDTSGVYTKLGTIIKCDEKYTMKEYTLDSSFGTYAADELKLIKTQ